MSESHFDQLFVSVAVGVGLMSLGLWAWLSRRWHWAARLGIMAVATTPGVGVLALVDCWHCLPLVGTSLLAAMAGYWTLASSLWTRATTWFIDHVHRPTGRAVVLLTAGPCLTIGGIAHYEWTEDKIADQVLDEMMLVHGVAGNVQVRHAVALTDRGRRLQLGEPIEIRDRQTVQAAEYHYLQSTRRLQQVIIRGYGDDRSNCHGWVFTDGRYLLSGQDVLKILEDNGYEEVTDPRPNDVVVYLTQDYSVSHTAIVRYVTPGQPVLVEGKWGNLGIFLHAVDDSPYGSTYKYYRTRRPNHLLQIVEDPSVTSTNQPVPPSTNIQTITVQTDTPQPEEHPATSKVLE